MAKVTSNQATASSASPVPAQQATDRIEGLAVRLFAHLVADPQAQSFEPAAIAERAFAQAEAFYAVADARREIRPETSGT